MVASKQGRPKKEGGLSGREKLVIATHDYLRRRPKLRLTRTEIADACGVTPALVSYYFPGKDSLLVSVMKPLMAGYQRRLLSFTTERADEEETMRRIIRLLVEMNADDGFLVDYLLDHVGMSGLDAEDQESTNLFRATLSHLLTHLMSAGIWQSSDVEYTRLTLWASCRVLGERLRHQIEQQKLDGQGRTVALDNSVDFICGLFIGPVDPNPSILVRGAPAARRSLV